jgi:hypothetical protein
MLVSYFWCVSNFDQYSKSVSCLTSYNSQPCYLLFYNHRVNILSIYASFDLKTANILCREILQVVQTTVRLCLVRRAARSVLIMWPCRDISHIQVFVFLPFSNSTHKTETGTAHWSETTNRNPPGPIKLSSQSAAGVTCFAVPCTNLCTLFKMLGQNHFLEPNWQCCDFPSSNFLLQGPHSGAALTHKHEKVVRIKWNSFKCYHLGQPLCSLSQLLIMLLTSNFHFWCFHGAVILSEI